jgi:hypothetical protein
VEVAARRLPAQVRHATPAEADLRPGLRARLDLDLGRLAVDRLVS